MSNTVILNVYKRVEYLKEQVNAILCQTVKPTDIWIWDNCEESQRIEHKEILKNVSTKINNELGKKPCIFDSSVNKKYHARFAIGLLASTEYVSFFDDDTIPGDMWFENCLNTMKETPGILGGAGCILYSKHYAQHQRVGWPGQNPVTCRADLVGHAWFMKRDHLNYMWYETPFTFENGEDIQLSYLAKKYGNVNTYTPPHPSEKPRMHSSLKAEEYGNDSKASSNGSLMSIPHFYAQRDSCIDYCLKNGWKTLIDLK